MEDKEVQGTTFNLSRSGCAIEAEGMATVGETVRSPNYGTRAGDADICGAGENLLGDQA